MSSQKDKTAEMGMFEASTKYSNSPFNQPYDPLGRGASPNIALLLEAIANFHPFYGNNSVSNVSQEELAKNNMYGVSPEFLYPFSEGSGTYFETGTPYAEKILLNSTRPAQEMFGEIIPHELRHRETGGMGGITSPTSMDAWIRARESESRLPQERFAYGPTVWGQQQNLMLPTKYYLQGDFRRQLQNYE